MKYQNSFRSFYINVWQCTIALRFIGQVIVIDGKNHSDWMSILVKKTKKLYLSDLHFFKKYKNCVSFAIIQEITFFCSVENLNDEKL